MSTSINGTTGIDVSAVNASAITADRTSTDGTIVDLQKDGTTVGSIISVLNGSDRNLDIGSGDTRLLFYGPTTPAYVPRKANNTSSDGYADLGLSSNRFKDLYLSGGAYLGGTGSANKLDDYEEGSSTITMYGSGSTPATPLTFTAKYTKIGNQVSIFGATTGSPNTTGYSGYPYFGGLPFTPITGGMGNAMGYNAFTFSYDGGLVTYWDTGGYAYIYENASGSYWRTININPTTSIGIKISGTYYTF